MQNQEEFINEEEIITPQKTKKQPSQAQLDHLCKIREIALLKKKEMKELTEKAKLQLELESNKLSKKLEKEELARRYEQHLKTSKEPIEVTFEDGKKIEEVKKIEESQPKKDNPKTKKKIIKKIVYEEETDDEYDDDDSIEEVIVKKTKSKIKQLQQEMKPIQPSKFYSELVNESSLDKLRQKMMDERCRSLLSSVTPDYR